MLAQIFCAAAKFPQRHILKVWRFALMPVGFVKVRIK